MSHASVTPIDRNAAAERLADLDDLARRPGISGETVYHAALQAIAKTMPVISCELSFTSSVHTIAPSDPSETTTTELAAHVTDRIQSEPRGMTVQRIHRLSPDAVIRLRCELDLDATGEADAAGDSMHEGTTDELRDEFLDAILDAVAFGFLKDRFLASAAPAGESTLRQGAQLNADDPNATDLSGTEPSDSNRGGLWVLLSKGRVLALTSLVSFGLLFVPVPFGLPIEGVLEPSRFRDVFAPHAGKVRQWFVEDGQSVTEGTLLARIDNADIDLESERLTGELIAARTELLSIRVQQSDVPPEARRVAAAGRWQTDSGRQMVLRARIDSLEKQVKVVEAMRESLTVRSAIAGRIRMPQSQKDLMGQDITQGQWLLQVVNPDGGYVARLRLADRDFGYLQSAQATTTLPIPASVRLRSRPRVILPGRVMEVVPVVTRDDRGEGVIEVLVRIEPKHASDVRLGASVVGDLHVGKRALGLVLFRPLIEFLRSFGW